MRVWSGASSPRVPSGTVAMSFISGICTRDLKIAINQRPVNRRLNHFRGRFLQLKRRLNLVFGVNAEFFPKRALSSIEERGAGISQRPKPILERFGRPDVVAIKTDVSPAEWSDVGQHRVG